MYVMPLLVQECKQNFCNMAALDSKMPPIHCTSKIKNRWAKRGVWYKMFHVTDVFYWGNPNPKKSLSFTPYTILGNYKYAHNSENT